MGSWVYVFVEIFDALWSMQCDQPASRVEDHRRVRPRLSRSNLPPLPSIRLEHRPQQTYPLVIQPHSRRTSAVHSTASRCRLPHVTHSPRPSLLWFAPSVEFGLCRFDRQATRAFQSQWARFARPGPLAIHQARIVDQAAGPIRRSVRRSADGGVLASLPDLTRGRSDVRLVVGFSSDRERELVRLWLFESHPRPRCCVDRCTHFPVRSFIANGP